jgi:hypothetical protein
MILKKKNYFIVYRKFRNYSYRDQYFAALPKVLENMKDASILQKALFLPSFLENLKPSASVYSQAFASEHYISFLYVCLRQADTSYWERADFFKYFSQENKVIK